MQGNREYPYMVSVYMTTYYHEKYVADAIESILRQKVSFPYEIVISDDCSKDGTPSILKEYEEKYSFIRIKLNETNIGLSNNMFLAKSMCVGKYIIVLSGDDYWIDSEKLQRQVDFLEAHSEYIGVSTRLAAVSEETGETFHLVPAMTMCNRKFTLEDYLQGKNFPMNGMLLRNVIQEHYDMFSMMPQISPYIDDTTDCMFILTLGDIYISDEVTVAYRLRIAKKGEHNFNSLNTALTKFEKVVSLLNNLDAYWNGEYDLINRYKKLIGPAMVKCMRTGNLEEFNRVYSTIPLKYRSRGLKAKSVAYLGIMAVQILQRKVSKK